MQLAKHKTEGNVKLMGQRRGPFTVHMANELTQHPGGVSEMGPVPQMKNSECLLPYHFLAQNEKASARAIPKRWPPVANLLA